MPRPCPYTCHNTDYCHILVHRDDNGSGQAQIVPTCNSTRKKIFTYDQPIYPLGIRLKNTCEFF